MTDRFDLFLSYNRQDRAVVEDLARQLEGRQLRVFKDDWHLTPGDHWPSALERHLSDCRAVAVVIGPHSLGPWQRREIYAAIDREIAEHEAGRADFRVIPVLLDEGSRAQAGLGFLSQNVWVEAWDPRWPDLIAGALEGKTPEELYDEAHPDPRTLICPYRGLNVFQEEDQAFFFGREADLDKLIATVDRVPLVAIVGASGSGKSSLARAGLVPRLRRRTDGQVWQIATLVPGPDPFLSLARALLPHWEPKKSRDWSKNEAHREARTLAASLADDGAHRLRDVVGEIFAEEPGTSDLLLLIDQWEELYTYKPDSAATFIAMLLDAVRERGIKVVLTVRADYWGEVLTHHPPLANRLAGEATVHLPALQRDGLEAVIRKPAEKTCLAIQPALVEALLNDAEDQPGDLPLLEFALRQLWIARTGKAGTLTLHAYEQMGRLAQSIVKHAETVYARLTPEEKEAMPGVFAALVHVGEARTDLRRRARLSELTEAGQAVARRLAGQRLLVTSRDSGTGGAGSGEDMVEVAHEALLRHWPMLKGWIDSRRAALLTIRQLQADTKTWLEKHKSPSYQWSHERAREAAAALRQLGDEVVLSDQERAFLGPVDIPGMLADIERPETMHRHRALIGERLAVLGDPRRGVDIDAAGVPDIACREAWREIPGGEVALEDGPAETALKRVKKFSIGRFPVTVAQYKAFLGAEDGWADSAWWGDDLYRDPEGNSYDVGRFANHPAVYINWFDAMAFCRWLSRRLGFAVRLPDEWEWQQAATGGNPDNSFPWGPDWDPKLEPNRANTFESRLGGVTAVGMYPAGASAQGVCDMAGTVWEWCLNKHDWPEVTASGENDFDWRVLRGGSWYVNRDFARCAFRFWFFPNYRSYVVRFSGVMFVPHL